MDLSAFLSFAENILQVSGFALLLSCFIAFFVYLLFKCFFKINNIWRDISIAGTIVLVTAQLIGAFSGVMFPIMLGPDVSDYSISCDPVDLKIVIPDSLIDEEVAAKLNHTSVKRSIFNMYTVNISVNNLNPLRKYNKQVYITSSCPPEFEVNVFSPVLKIDHSSELRIGTRLNDLRTDWKYPIVVQATGADGKKRNCTISIRAISEYEANPTMTLNNRGVELYNLGKYNESIEDFDRAIEIDTQNAVAWSNKGAALASMDLYNDALESFNNATKFNPQYSAAWHGKGFVLENQGKITRGLMRLSQQALSKYVDKEPDIY
jgi:tetratricopeptide (TPR) repeat protein